jgi:uncharacterized protein (DUF1800 family)
MTATPSLPPDAAWQPLPDAEWNADAARHLLRRAGWTAPRAWVERAQREGLAATLDRLYPASPLPFAEPVQVTRYAEQLPVYAERERAAQTPEDKRLIQRQRREHAQTAVQDMSLRWLAYAAQPENAAFAKWVLFLSDIYVVGFDKVQDPAFIWQHFDLLGRLGLGAAPLLTKAVSRSPAMMLYLDLNQNRREAPNENFARELFELFVLGEGNYTEKDIKEAARAFTGYRLRPATGEVLFVANQHDHGLKTVFGTTGNLDGDAVIDLAYGTPAAGAFVPHELVKFYLSDQMLPAGHLRSLGDAWRTAGGYDLRWLARTFFGSRLFFAPEFRGDFIKSPIQFYLGLVQDLDLNVVPLQRLVLNPLRQMGQVLFTPPNVRGWVGGRAWVNSATLAARRTMVELLFNPIDEARLNADEQLDLLAAHTNGVDRFTFADARLQPLQALPPPAAVRDLETEFLPIPSEPAFTASLAGFIAAGAAPAERAHRLRRAVIALLESPEYQLC